MRGRLAITTSPDALRALFGFADEPTFPPRYNIAPTQPIPIVRAETAEGGPVRRFQLVRWGFLPSFVKAPNTFPLLFNAKAEGIADKPSFRNALRRRRCLVPADAFYAWRRFGGDCAAQPFVCRRVDGMPMALAALWETWAGPNGEEVDTACIVTAAANGVSAAIHPRLPVVVEPTRFAVWLDPDERSLDDSTTLLRPPDNAILCVAPVSDAVNKVANDGPDLMVPTGPTIAAGPCGSAGQLDLL